MVSPQGRKLVSPERRDEDAAEASLRPQKLGEFIGQQQARSNLAVFIEAARARKEALDHVLFVGPPGLGKTTLAQIVSRELGVNFRATSGPVITDPSSFTFSQTAYRSPGSLYGRGSSRILSTAA